MQFLVTGYDGKDKEAPVRRQAVRDDHLKRAQALYEAGTMLYAAAILDRDGGMIGSVLLMDFASEEALRQQWLDSEPYVTGGVWREIKVEPCKVPGFIMKGQD